MSEYVGEWQYTTIGEICDWTSGTVQTGPFGSDLHASDYSEYGTPVIMPANLGKNQLIEDGIARVGEEHVKRLKQHTVINGDIVFPRRGDVARYVLIDERYIGWLCGTGCLRIRFAQNSIIEPKYLGYWLGTETVENWLLSNAVGTTMPNLNTSILKVLPVPLPPLPEQHAIAHILGSLDDKIELNRRMNATLEATARALFKSWFVDFDPVRAKAEGRDPDGMDAATSTLFPASFDESELGLIPSGWKQGTLGDVLVNFDSKRIPLSSQERETRKGCYPYYGATSIVDYIDDYLFDGIYLLLAEDGASVQTKEGKPTLQYVWGQFWVNNHAHVLRGNGSISTEQLYILLKDVNIVPFVTGAVQPKINQANLYRIPIVVSDERCNAAFFDLVKPMFERLRLNTDENLLLAATRDALLPRLMSGELRVNDIQEEV
jgi:type I restriction enzyme, S subunit